MAAHYNNPVEVSAGDGAYKTQVRFDDQRPIQRTVSLYFLTRQALMKVAGAIAKQKGEKTGGVKWTNKQFQNYILKQDRPFQIVPEPKAKLPKKRQPGKRPKLGLEPHIYRPQDQFKEGEDELKEYDDGDRKKTEVTCSCGHKYTYRIKQDRFDGTKKWLESKPCPPCQRGIDQGDKPAPQQDGEPPEDQEGDEPEEPEDEELKEDLQPKLDLKDLDLDTLADVLVQKVQERMKPVELPPLHHEVMPEVVKLLNADVPVWLQGPPGTSKSTIAIQAAEALELPLHAMSCHEAMTRSDMFGYTDANGTDHRSPLWDAYENGGVLLLDEIDNGNANILAALNSALSNGHCTFAGRTYQKHDKFKVVATANTAGLGPEAGFIGRMGVDLATLDRFVSLHVPIDEKLETAIVKAILPKGYSDVLKKVRKLRKLVDSRGIRTVVSPRTSIHTARMLKAGVSLANSLRRTAFKGMDEGTVSSLLSEVGVEDA